MSFGGGGAGQASLDFQKETVKKQHQFDKKQYAHQWNEELDEDGKKKGTVWQNYDYQLESIKIAEQNDLAAKNYKEDSANQQWNYQNQVKDFEENIATQLYNKNQVQVANQFALNETAVDVAIKEVDKATEEAFIDAAFQNQAMIDDLWHETGSTGLAKAKAALGLEKAESSLEYQQDKSIVEYGQQVSSTKFQTAGKQLDLKGKTIKAGLEKAGITQDVLNKEAKNTFDKATLAADISAAAHKSKYEVASLRNDVNRMRSDAAFKSQENIINNLKAMGQATASGQAGRSQGKAIASVIAALGRQELQVAQQLVHGKAKAEATAKLIQQTQLHDTQKAAIASQKIDLKSLDAIQKADLALTSSEESLKLAGQKTDLDIGQLKDSLLGVTELTNLSTKQIDDQMQNAQNQAGIDFSKFDLDTLKKEKDFDLNTKTIQANLDKALSDATSSKDQIALKKLEADLATEAMSQLRPEPGPDIPEPIPLPNNIYQDPLKPTLPPEPMEGAMPTYAGPSFGQKAVSGAIAGLGATAMMGGFSTGGLSLGVAGPIGAAIGIATMLFG